MFGKAYSAIGGAFNKLVNPIANTVNKGVKIYKEIPEEHREVIEAKVGDVAKGVRTDYPPKVREFLAPHNKLTNTGDDGAFIVVHTLQIVIEPLAPVVEMMANKMTKGEASAYAHQRGFDGFFHAGLLINGKYSIDKHKEGIYVGPNTFRGALNPKVKVLYHHINITHLVGGSPPGNEEVLSTIEDYNTGEEGFTGFYDNSRPSPAPRRRGYLADIDGGVDNMFLPESRNDVALTYATPPHTVDDRTFAERRKVRDIFKPNGGVARPEPKGLTIGKMLERTREMLGDKEFFSYDLFTNNCCLFVMSVLKANGLLDESAERFVHQDIEGLGKKMPGWSSAVSKIFTDATNLVSIAQTGR
jgi:hypothetical protein